MSTQAQRFWCDGRSAPVINVATKYTISSCFGSKMVHFVSRSGVVSLQSLPNQKNGQIAMKRTFLISFNVLGVFKIL